MNVCVKNTFVELEGESPSPRNARYRTCPQPFPVESEDEVDVKDLEAAPAAQPTAAQPTPVLLGSPAQSARDEPPPLAVALPLAAMGRGAEGKIVTKNTFIHAQEEADEAPSPQRRRHRTCPAPKADVEDRSSDQEEEESEEADLGGSSEQAGGQRQLRFSVPRPVPSVERVGDADDGSDDELPTTPAGDRRRLVRTEDLQESLGLDPYRDSGFHPDARRGTEELRESLYSMYFAPKTQHSARDASTASPSSSANPCLSPTSPVRVDASAVVSPGASTLSSVPPVGFGMPPTTPPVHPQHAPRMFYMQPPSPYGGYSMAVPPAVAAPWPYFGYPPPQDPPILASSVAGNPMSPMHRQQQRQQQHQQQRQRHQHQVQPQQQPLHHQQQTHFVGHSFPQQPPSGGKSPQAAMSPGMVLVQGDSNPEAAATVGIPRGGGRRLRLWAHIYLHMQVDGFDLVPRLIGRGGCNMRRIAEQTGAKIRIRGRGSGHLEIDRGDGKKEEAPTPLMVAVTTDKCDPPSFRTAIAMTLQELRTVEVRYMAHCEKFQISHEGPCYSIGLLPEGGKDILADIIRGVPVAPCPSRCR